MMIATHGVPNFGCTAATFAKKSLSSAIAKKIRGLVKSTVFSVPNVDISTVSETKMTPDGPITRNATSAATSRDCAIPPIPSGPTGALIGSTAR